MNKILGNILTQYKILSDNIRKTLSLCSHRRSALTAALMLLDQLRIQLTLTLVFTLTLTLGVNGTTETNAVYHEYFTEFSDFGDKKKLSL